jgi:hypothetical protein
MGLLKKIFKPISKVLDKIIPNEIKPALPYLAAFAPYLGPMQGIMGSGMMQRALMSGGLNIGAQLAQEGSEGDINLLSAGLGALQGAMTAPGTPGIGGTTLPGQATPGATPGAAQFLREKALGMEPGMMKSGLEALSGGSKFLTGAAETLQSNPFSVEGLKAAAIPFAQGTADVMYAEGQRDLKDLANDVVDDMGGGYSDDAYRAAIRKSMTAYGATEQEIIDAIEAAGYKSGGRVGLAFGGIGAAVEKVEDKQMKETMKLAQDMDMPIEDIVEEFMIIHKRKPNSIEELKMFYRDKYKWKGPGDVKMQETVKETFTAKDGGTPSVLPKGIEADYRGGGFIPIGSKERADDVPARLSENEFVMTADAVRAAGGGNVNKGAQRMYNVMNNLEARA